MPLALISRNPSVVNDALAQEIARKLPAIIASALDTSDKDERGRLTADDVEVYVRDYSRFDFNVKSLEIIIWANQYPAREKNLDERRAKIVEGIRALIAEFKSPNIKGFVWVLLQPGSFEEL